eukprot:1260612-Rhodomonas_salina.2
MGGCAGGSGGRGQGARSECSTMGAKAEAGGEKTRKAVCCSRVFRGRHGALTPDLSLLGPALACSFKFNDAAPLRLQPGVWSLVPRIWDLGYGIWSRVQTPEPCQGPRPSTLDSKPETGPKTLDPRPSTLDPTRPKTQDPRPKTQDPRPETRDPRPEQGPRPGTRDPRPETLDLGTENRDPRP